MKSNEDRHLANEIHVFEDQLLRCKDYKQQMVFQEELIKMRKQAQKLYFQRIGS